MEISRQDFVRKLPIVKAAIDECDFMAIDTELSGKVDIRYCWTNLFFMQQQKQKKKVKRGDSDIIFLLLYYY